MMTNLQSSAFVARTTQLLSSVARLRLLLVMLLTLTASTAWGQTTTTYTFSSKSWAASPANWTSGKDGNQMQSGRGIQVTTGASGANATSPKSFTNVSKIVVTYSTNASAGAGTIKIKIGSNTEVSQDVTKTGGTTDRTLTYNFSPNQTGSVKVTVTCSTNSIYLKSIAITEAAATVNHNVTWKVNGETYTTGSPTTSVPEGSKVTILPTAPTLDCSGKTFVGWSNQEVTDGNKPSVLFTTAENSPAINADTTFYAVFATNSGGGEGEISLTASDFGLTTSYATKTATVDGYSFTIDQGYLNGTNNIQMNSSRGNGILYNTTPIPGLSTITLNVASGTNTKTLYSGTTQQPTTSVGTTTSTKTFSIPAGNTYFKIGVSGANYFSSIVITYSTTSYSDYTTSCTTETAVYLIPKNSDFWMAYLRRIFGLSSAYLRRIFGSGVTLP